MCHIFYTWARLLHLCFGGLVKIQLCLLWLPGVFPFKGGSGICARVMPSRHILVICVRKAEWKALPANLSKKRCRKFFLQMEGELQNALGVWFGFWYGMRRLSSVITYCNFIGSWYILKCAESAKNEQCDVRRHTVAPLPLTRPAYTSHPSLISLFKPNK